MTYIDCCAPFRVVVMGVAGSGKSTVGRAMAGRLAARFVDADDLHTPESIGKMRSGEALDDGDRWPWLVRVGTLLAEADASIVVACSALKRSYRDLIRRHAPDTGFLFLHGSPTVLADRLSQRSDHFMLPTMLESQLAILEPLASDELGAVLDVQALPARLVYEAINFVQRRFEPR